MIKVKEDEIELVLLMLVNLIGAKLNITQERTKNSPYPLNSWFLTESLDSRIGVFCIVGWGHNIIRVFVAIMTYAACPRASAK